MLVQDEAAAFEARHAGLLARCDMFKASTVFRQQMIDLSRTLLERNQLDQVHSPDEILEDVESSLPPAIVVFTQEYFESPMFPCDTTLEGCETLRCRWYSTGSRIPATCRILCYSPQHTYVPVAPIQDYKGFSHATAPIKSPNEGVSANISPVCDSPPLSRPTN
eukprot:IDg5968t1